MRRDDDGQKSLPVVVYLPVMNHREARAILERIGKLVEHEASPVPTREQGGEDPMQARMFDEPLHGICATIEDAASALRRMKDPSELPKIMTRLDTAIDSYDEDIRPQLAYYAELAGARV